MSAREHLSFDDLQRKDEAYHVFNRPGYQVFSMKRKSDGVEGWISVAFAGDNTLQYYVNGLLRCATPNDYDAYNRRMRVLIDALARLLYWEDHLNDIDGADNDPDDEAMYEITAVWTQHDGCTNSYSRQIYEHFTEKEATYFNNMMDRLFCRYTDPHVKARKRVYPE